jgi:phage-related protein
MSHFVYNGKSSLDFNIRVERCPSYPVPQRVVEKISVMGRNGDLLLDTGAYSNVTQSYDIYFNAKSTSFQVMARSVALWLNGTRGYKRLEDTYDPDIFRLAEVSDYHEYKNFLNYMGRLTVDFDCKPQRYLKVGEEEMSLTSGEDIFNAWMPCYPIFKLTGNGTLNVNGNTIGISNNLNKTIVIDCETQNAYTGTENRNGDIYVTGEFPFLVSGENEITFNNTCSMIPRWWTL